MLADVLTAITTVGFPIVACIYIGYIYDKVQKKLFDVIEANTKALTEVKEEMHHVALVVRGITDTDNDENL